MDKEFTRYNNKRQLIMGDFNDIQKFTQQKPKQFTSANIIEVTVASNGLKGGDSVHGSKTYFSLEDISSTDMVIRTLRSKVGMKLDGDSKLQTFIESLRWAADTSEKKS